MTWQPSEDHVALFAPNKQRSAAYTLERRSLRAAMLEFAQTLEGEWDCTPAEPCLANRRQVKNMVLFSQATRADGQRAQIDLNSPFALDVLPFHEHLSRFVQIDQSGLTWGLILHRKAKLDGRNVVAFLEAFEGREALKELLEPLADAVAGRQIQEPQAEGERADQVLPEDYGAGWCVWWRASVYSEALPDTIRGDLVRLSELFKALKWTHENDLCGALAEHKAERKESAKSRFQEGDRVRITAGLFAGRIGRVEKRHEKGGVSLGIGPMTIQVGDDEIAPL